MIRSHHAQRPTSTVLVSTAIFALVTMSACAAESASDLPTSPASSPTVPVTSVVASPSVPVATVTPTEPVGTPSSIAEAGFTNASLSALLSSVMVDGEPLKPVPVDYLSNVVENTQATIDILQGNSLEPKACKTALIASLEIVNVKLPVTVGGNDVMVQLFAFADEAGAQAAVAAQQAVIDACSTYTLTSDDGGESVSSKTVVTDGGITAASVPDAVSAASSYSFDGEPATTLTTSGSVGNVFIQVTDSFASDAATKAVNSATLEAVGAAVAEALDR